MSDNLIRFRISGSLPAPWEDFLALDQNYPNITIMTRANADDCGGEYGDGSDGWCDLILDVDLIDEDVARLAIADALGIDNPEHVLIEQVGFCQSA